MKRLKLILFALPGIVLYSCKKDGDNDTLQPLKTESFQSIESFFESRVEKGEDFKIMAHEGATITTKNNTIFTIPPSAFSSSKSSNITADGTINIRVKEVVDQSEMIFNGIFPYSHSNVINSSGEFYFGATDEFGGKLGLIDGMSINVKIVAREYDPDMKLFYAGDEENVDPDSINWQTGDFNWNEVSFNSSDNTYSFELDSLAWANVDAFLPPSVEYIECSFDLVGVSGLDESNTTAYSVFENENAVWPFGYTGSIGANRIEDHHLAAIPTNILVISVVNTELYYGLLNVTPADKQTYQVNMEKISSVELDKIIRALP